jgi:glycine hydroxymethyltransferase
MIRDLIHKSIEEELERQNEGIELIASENYASKYVREVQSSILTNKYAEGYPNRRYYGGCEYIDKIEQEAINGACVLFNVRHANVQPHSGSQANAAAYRALEKYLKLDRKMKILSIKLNDGGHLTHGSAVSFSSNNYDFSFYDLGADGKIDFDLVEKAIIENKPDVILSGYSSYPYEVNFKTFKDLADKYNCLFMVDMAHIAGLVAAGRHSNPCLYADIVTSTTHKTLRGPRGGLILTNNDELAKLVNSAVFPYYQGGPLEHIIAAKAICFEEARSNDFKVYAWNVVSNTSAFAKKMKEYGAECTESENHLMLLNTKKSYGLTGKEAQQKLEEIDITTNKNMLPNDDETPATTSGLRIGFAAMTTRGCTQEQAEFIATVIHSYLSGDMPRVIAKMTVHYITSQMKNVEDLG